MRRILILLVTALILAAPFKADAALQCVTYAREASGLNLKGDAWQWWNAAQGVYERGRAPKEEAVLVFSRQGNMRHGHVSVITRVVSNRVVLVNHANWAPSRSAGRGQIAEAVQVLDVSPRNDWSQVRVWHKPANDYGNRTYRTEGFVYNPRAKLHRAAMTHEAPKAKAPEARPEPRPAPPEAKIEAKIEPKAEPAVATLIEPTLRLDEHRPTPVATPVVTPVAAPFLAPAPAPAPVAPPARAFDARDWAEQA